jgi:integrase
MRTSYNLLKPYDETIIDGIKQRKPANRECRVYLVFTIGRGQQKRFKTDLKINARHWDFSKQQVKPQAPGSVKTNDRLRKMTTLFIDNYNELMNTDPKPTFEEMVTKLDVVVKTGTLPTPTKKDEITFFRSFDLFLDFKAEETTNRNHQKFKTLHRALREYDQQKDNITFDIIDLSFYRKFKSFLHTRKNIMTGEKGYRDDTVKKYMKGIKTFLTWSHEEGHHKNVAYQNKKWETTAKTRHEIVTLTPEEVRRLIDYDFSDKPHLDRVRDLFVFLLHTGQRWSDVQNFEPKQVKSGVWEFKAQKTNKPMKIPLIGFAKPADDVLRKYGGNIPKMVEQVFNRSLKNVGEQCGIKEEVTITRWIKGRKTHITKPKFEFMSSHMGRRTMVTILADRGVPLTSIQEITGHEDIKTLMKYKRSDPDQIAKAFEQGADDAKPVTGLRAV